MPKGKSSRRKAINSKSVKLALRRVNQTKDGTSSRLTRQPKPPMGNRLLRLFPRVTALLSSGLLKFVVCPIAGALIVGVLAAYCWPLNILQNKGIKDEVKELTSSVAHLAQLHEEYRDIESAQSPIQIGDLLGQASQATGKGRPSDALSILERAEILAITPDDKARVALALGAVLGDLGQNEDARKQYETAELQSRFARDRSIRGNALGAMGLVLQGDGQAMKAEMPFRGALQIFTEIGDQAGRAKTIHNLSRLHWQIGLTTADQARFEQAREEIKNAQAINTVIDRQQGRLLNLLWSARMNRGLGHREEAEADYLEALATAEGIDSQMGIMNASWEYAGFLRTEKSFDEATASAERALSKARELGLLPEEVDLLGLLGLIARDADRIDAAAVYHKEALVLAKVLAVPPLEGVAVFDIGEVAFARGEFEQAIVSYEAALSIARENGIIFLEGLSLLHLGSAYYRLGDHEQAVQYLCDARQHAYQYGGGLDIFASELPFITIYGDPSRVCR